MTWALAFGLAAIAFIVGLVIGLDHERDPAERTCARTPTVEPERVQRQQLVQDIPEFIPHEPRMIVAENGEAYLTREPAR